jgi:hypothetical protein
MRVLFIEGKDGETLRQLARELVYDYRLMYRAEQELYLLQVGAYLPELEERVAQLKEFRSWSFEVLEESARES